MNSHIHPKAKSFLRLKLILLLSFLVTIKVSNAQLIPVTAPPGGFHIDGDLKANTPNAGVGDWVQGTAGSGGFVFFNSGVPVNPLKTKLEIDPYDGNDLIYQGSKFNDNPALWLWANSKASAKNDINNVMYHLAVDGNNETWIIMGSDRLSNNGTSYIDFEFLQNTVTRNPVSGFSTQGPHGGRTINDLVISMEYSNGGSTANLRFYLWKPVGPGYDYVEQTIPPTVAFGKSNNINVDVPFGAFGSNSYLPYTFVEAAVNVTDLFGAIDPCLGISVKTIIVKTKASTSLTANLGDFVEPIQVTLNLGTASVSYLNANSLCPNGTASVILDGVTGGTFSASSAGLSINALTGEINLSASTPGTYTITYSFVTSECPRSVNTQVTILPLPQPPISASSDQNLLCYGHSGNIVLSASGGSGATLKWFQGSCNGVLVGTGNNLSIPAPSQTTSYYAAWENNCGISSCAAVTVTVLPQLTLYAAVTQAISYYNAADGQITITATGGTGNYTYALNGGTPQLSNVFSGLPAGTYSITVYDTHGCVANGSITIPNALQIVANDDAGSANGMSGGTAVANVLVNDMLNGSPVNTLNVNLSFISSTNPNITLAGTSVAVAPGTPAGSYTLVYQICETANLSNCDQADVVVTVTAAPIVAENEKEKVTKKENNNMFK